MHEELIAIHGYRKSYSREEQLEIYKAIKPIIDLAAEMINKHNETHMIVEVSPGVYEEREI